MSPFTSADVKREVEAAEERIRGLISTTPLEPSFELSRRSGAEVLVKMENLQVTRSFKARGAFNALLTLDEAVAAKGVVTASSGNHAMAMANAMSTLGIDGEIWLSELASPAKIEALRTSGANLRLTPEDDPEPTARQEAERTGRIYISPYNDPFVIGGQGTIGIELMRQTSPLDVVYVPVGGGGLISGIAGYLKEVSPGTRVIGCQPFNSQLMVQSVEAGELLQGPWEPTISDGTAGPSEQGSITFPICRDLVAEWVTVTEDEIASAIAFVMAQHSVLVEGAGALSVASFLKTADRWKGMRVALILSGARIQLSKLAKIISVAG
jgi:threonine dehydratase